MIMPFGLSFFAKKKWSPDDWWPPSSSLRLDWCGKSHVATVCINFFGSWVKKNWPCQHQNEWPKPFKPQISTQDFSQTKQGQRAAFPPKKIFLARHCTLKPPTIFSCTCSMLPDTPKTKIHAYRRHLSAVNSSFHRGLEVLFSMKLRALEVAMEKYLRFEQEPWLVVWYRGWKTTQLLKIHLRTKSWVYYTVPVLGGYDGYNCEQKVHVRFCKQKTTTTEVLILFSKISPTCPWTIPRTFHQQLMFRNLFRIVGVKGEVWGPIFPGYVSQGLNSLYWGWSSNL